MNDRELIALRGKFTDAFGKISEEIPQDDEVFAICAGPWPYPQPEGVAVKCFACKGQCGVDTTSWAMHVRNRQRGIFCSPCFRLLMELLRERRMIQ